MYSIFPAMYPGAITRGESEKNKFEFWRREFIPTIVWRVFFLFPIKRSVVDACENILNP